jgi:hypothetical protein
MSSAAFDASGYVETARQFALAGVTHALDVHGGSLIESEIVEDENGYWLTVLASWRALPNTAVRYSRLLLHVDGPDKDAETEGIIYGSGFIERLLTRASRLDAVDGVITL